jgi:hypothetical protein
MTRNGCWRHWQEATNKKHRKPQAQEGTPAPTQAPAAEEHVEYAAPTLKIEVRTVVEPFSFYIAVPELKIELRTEVEPSSYAYCMATNICISLRRRS